MNLLPDPELFSNVHSIWRDQELPNPPLKTTFYLNYAQIKKAMLTFRFDMSTGFGSYLNPGEPVVINNKAVWNLELPIEKKLLQVVDRRDIDVTDKIRSSPNGEANTIAVNYILSGLAIASLPFKKPLGRISLSIQVFFVPNSVSDSGVKTGQGASAQTPKKPEIPEQPAVMTCWKCHKALTPPGQFCGNCGAAQK